MRCDDFDNVVFELTRDGSFDTAARASAVSHAVSCDRCASRLAGERHLNETLAIAAAVETDCAPLSVKLALLQAFNGRSQAPPAIASSAAARPASRWYVVAAAAVLAALVVISVRISIRRPERAAVQPAGQEVSLKAASERTIGAVAPVQAPGRNKPAHGLREGLHKALSHRRELPNRLSHTGDVDRALSESEALSDFIPLTHLSTATAIESGQVVRVKVPLSAFIAFGLPVSPEHADQVVNAELVVGDDGVNRAVRLVR